jgi:peptidoglycan/xylan/chitin deacetylase (PgdA/CDA1 family)
MMPYLLFHKSIPKFSFSATNFEPKRLRRLLNQFGADGELAGIGLTFDDGYEHYVDVLPALIEEFRIRPLVFVPTGLIGKPASWDFSYPVCRLSHLERRSIRKLAGLGVEFGSHGHTHSDLTALNQRRLDSELSQSRDILSELTGRRVDTISYPFGRWNRRVIQTANEFGFERGFTSHYPTTDDNALAVGRIPIYGFDTTLSIAIKLGHRSGSGIEEWKSKVVTKLSGGTVLLNRMRPSQSR